MTGLWLWAVALGLGLLSACVAAPPLCAERVTSAVPTHFPGVAVGPAVAPARGSFFEDNYRLRKAAAVRRLGRPRRSRAPPPAIAQ